MRFKRSLALLGAITAVALPARHVLAANILSPNDSIIGIDNNRNLPGNTNTAAEGPPSAFDNNDANKWLTFGRSFTGAVVTLQTPGIVQSLQFTTGGDAPERDPVQYQLFGTNSAINSVDNGTGLENSWTLIGGGATGLAPDSQAATARKTAASPVNIANGTSYSSYKVLFTKLRKANANAVDPVTLANASTPNSMQVAEIRMFNGAGGAGTNIAQGPTAVVAIDQTDSDSPPTQSARFAIDGNKGNTSKYLNFGREGSGLIVTPSIGATVIKSFQITTANDTEARDPSAYEIYGTNSMILSIEDSEGTAEPWSLITSGTLALPTGRNADGDLIGFSNSTSYSSYKIIFPDNKGPDAGANSIQFSEIALFDTPVPEPATAGLLAVGALGLLARRRGQQRCGA